MAVGRGAESAEHQVGTADKVVHLSSVLCDFCGINHLGAVTHSSKPMAQAVENRV